jgi:hypothetical protein
VQEVQLNKQQQVTESTVRGLCCRRSDDQPPISVQGLLHADTAAMVSASLTTVAHSVEAWLGRRLHPLTIEVVDLAIHPAARQSFGPAPGKASLPHLWKLTTAQQAYQQQQQHMEWSVYGQAAVAPCDVHPWAVWMVGPGRLLVHAPLFSISKQPDGEVGFRAATLEQQEAMIAAVGRHLVLQLVSRLSQVGVDDGTRLFACACMGLHHPPTNNMVLFVLGTQMPRRRAGPAVTTPGALCVLHTHCPLSFSRQLSTTCCPP